MVIDSEHPATAVLEDFLVGLLPDDRSEAIARHVGSCETCQQIIPTLDAAGDTLISRIRAIVPDDPFEQEAACDAALRAIAAFGREPSVAARRSTAKQLDLPEIERLGEYKLLGRLGQGGMGTVYKALHLRLEKVVALKVLLAGRIGNDAAVARFQREMKAVGKLTHPNIVAAHDAGEADGMHYLVMELVRGVDLSKLARRVDRFDLADACEMIRQAAVGLQHAHRLGLVHRDIKPSNLMLADSENGPPLVKVLDLGLALLDGPQAAVERDLTSTGQLMGTLNYMAPEQGLDSHLVDIRADIYSLGATLYRLLVGEPPFAGEAYNSPLKMMRALATQSPPSIAEKRPDLPPGLVALVDRMLAKNPDDRFRTPQEVAEALAPFCAGCDLRRLSEQVGINRADRETATPVQTDGHFASAAAESGRTAASQSARWPSDDAGDELAPFGQPLDKQADVARAGVASSISRETSEPVPRAEAPGQPSRWRRRPAVVIGAAIVVVLLAGALVLTLRTRDGIVDVEIPEDGGLPDDVSVLLTQGGREIEITSQDRWIARVTPGQYRVELHGGDDSLEVESDRLIVRRGGRERLRVVRRSGGASREETGSAAATFPPAPDISGFWLDKDGNRLRLQRVDVRRFAGEVVIGNMVQKCAVEMEYLSDRQFGARWPGTWFGTFGGDRRPLSFVTGAGMLRLSPDGERLAGPFTRHWHNTGTVQQYGWNLMRTTPDWIAARWVLSLGGEVTVTQEDRVRRLERLDQLPDPPLVLTRVVLRDSDRATYGGLRTLEYVEHLEHVDLDGSGTWLRGDDLAIFADLDLPRLKTLSLNRTEVSDADLDKLAPLQSLERLELRETRVTAADIAKLREALPGCEVIWTQEP